MKLSGFPVICSPDGIIRNIGVFTEATLKPFPPNLPASSQPGLLITEDELALLDFLKTGLRFCGFTVWGASTGGKALNLFRQFGAEIHLALLDIRMPDLDGPQMFQALQALRPGLPCCFMSGGVEGYLEQDLLELGAARVFRKPFILTEVAKDLRSLAGFSEQRDGPRLPVFQNKATLDGQQAHLHDRSIHGLGLWLNRPVPVGTVLSLHFEEAAALQDCPVEVRHCRPHEDGWFVGCRLVG